MRQRLPLEACMAEAGQVSRASDSAPHPREGLGGAGTAQDSTNVVQDTLSKLTNKQKVRLIMMTFGVPRWHVHGAIIVNETQLNPVYADRLARIVKAAGDTRGYPPLVGADQEGGTVNRLGNLPQTASISFPSARAMQSMTPAQLRQEGLKWGRALEVAEVTMLLGPSMDAAAPGTLMDVQGRSFGTTPEEVVTRTTAFLEGVRAANPKLAIVAKHYPGYSVHGNSDNQRVIDSSPAGDVWCRAQPFDNPMIDGVMVSSIVYQNVDAQPACFSKIVIQQFRQKHDAALVMADDLCARGFVEENVRENAKRAFKAGCDVLLSLDNRKDTQIESAILELVRSDPAMQARLDESAARVLALSMRQAQRSGSGFRTSWPRTPTTLIATEAVRAMARSFATLPSSCIYRVASRFRVFPK